MRLLHYLSTKLSSIDITISSMGHDRISRNQRNLYCIWPHIELDAFKNGFKAYKPTKMGNYKLYRIYKPHTAELYTLNELGSDDLDSGKTSCSERPQPSHLVGQCKEQVGNARSQFRNNAGSCKRN